MPARNEEDWIEPCILSLIKYVDEIIVVDDNSTDDTARIVKSLANSYEKVRYVNFTGNTSSSLIIARELSLELANYKWILNFDADMVVKDLTVWINRLNNLDKNKYYIINLPRVNLEGDLNHQPKSFPFGGWTARIFTWSPDLHYTVKTFMEPRRHGHEDVMNLIGDDRIIVKSYEQISCSSLGRCTKRFPLYYQLLSWNEPLVFHCNIKSPKHDLVRIFLEEYTASKTNLTFEQYAEHVVTEEWGMTMEQAVDKIASAESKKLMPYDKEKYGELPEVLKNKK
jgi:glycosyltransferase involved in cell wall biosynthesis